MIDPDREISIVTLQVVCESCDADRVKEELEEWYYGSDVGMYRMSVNNTPMKLSNLDEDNPTPDWNLSVSCKFCDKDCHPRRAHLHQGKYVCEDCWDERLRTTE